MQGHLFLIERGNYEDAVKSLTMEEIPFVRLGASGEYVAIAVADDVKLSLNQLPPVPPATPELPIVAIDAQQEVKQEEKQEVKQEGD